jgi:hypothetical protein
MLEHGREGRNSRRTSWRREGARSVVPCSLMKKLNFWTRDTELSSGQWWG